jgi:hypothetical protein
VPTNGDDASVSAVLITADPESGKACLISVQIGPTTPDFVATRRTARAAPARSIAAQCG